MPTVSVYAIADQDLLWHPLSACSYNDALAVFRFRLPNRSSGVEWQTLLPSDERRRAQRFHREEDRRRFLYTRSVLRLLLGNYLNQLPETIQLTTGLTKKPQLADSTAWQFNVAHSGQWSLIAIGKESVGIDVEKIVADFSFQDMIPSTFSRQEQSQIEITADRLRRDARQLFYQFWTRKEALIKATAKGLDDDLSRIPALEGVHQVDRALLGDNSDWVVRSFALADDYPASVAYRSVASYPTFYTIKSGLFGHDES
ncbi:4'-phosphopantetheinyl transferase family protein [Spirosoma areae]